jgi:glycyl-tRNA synthetase
MQLSPEIAPTQVAVFPLMDKEGLGEKAQEIASDLRGKGLSVKYDDTGNIGKRYRRQDEVGTPICVTVDYETLEEDPETVTLRDRDSTMQKRVKISELEEEISSRL